MTKRIAIVETKPSYNEYKSLFEHEFDFDLYHLCSNAQLKKVLVRDVDIEINEDDYDYIILVGSDALKYFTKLTSITMYTGKLIEGKYLAIINPAMLAFKPEARPTWERSRHEVIGYIKGTIKDVVMDDSVAIGILNTKEANAFIQAAIDSPLDYIALDSETTSLYCRDGHMVGLSLCYDGLKAAYISTECFDEDTEELLQELYSSKQVIFHNAKFDLAFFEYHFNFKFNRFGDTMLLHCLIDETPGTHGLKQLAMRYTKYGDYEKPLMEWKAAYCKAHGVKVADFNYGVIPFDVMYPYAAIDALATFQLYEHFIKILENKRLRGVYENILIPGTRFLTDMQENGVPFDLTRLIEGQALMQKEIDEAIAALYLDPRIKEFETFQGKEFNPNSVLQLRVLMFDFLGLRPTGKKTGTGKDSTDAEVLTELADQSDIPNLILAIRQKSKIKNTYLDKIIPQLDKDGRLRTGFNLHTTTSGRLSSSGKLNMQQLPRDNPIVKGCIKAKAGNKIVAMDLTTAEMYVAAVLSGDEALMEIFRSGGNFHNNIAHKVFKLKCLPEEVQKLFPKERQAAKAVSFGILFGAGAKKISEQVTKDSGEYFSPGEAQEVIDDYFKSFHKLKAWINENETFIKNNGYVYSFFGRKRRVPNVASKDRGVVGHAVRSAFNFLIQSVASDINLLAAIDMHAYIKATGMKAKIFALVHDSILAEVPEDEVEHYRAKLLEFTQMDRGVSIAGSPIGCDFDVGDDYAFGKYEKKYG